MGGNKPLRLLGGRTMLSRAVERAQSWSDRVAIAVRSAEQVGASDVPCLIDSYGIEGPLGGLASALRMDSALVLTIPCDMPFLPDDLPVRLTAALGDRGAAIAASGGRVHPVCGLWRGDALAKLDSYAATGRRSLMGFAERVGFVPVDWEDDPFFNVNSERELTQAESRLG